LLGVGAFVTFIGGILLASAKKANQIVIAQLDLKQQSQ
jgi:hypothetical protein